MKKGLSFRKNRLLKEKKHDVYLGRSKIPDRTFCLSCGALYMNGRWTWQKVEGDVIRSTCPACRRIADNYPAGIIEIKGPFYSAHKEELTNLIHNVERLEMQEHALERIMKMETYTDSATVTTTGVHLARRIGEALKRAYKGTYSFNYLESENGIRIKWER